LLGHKPDLVIVAVLNQARRAQAAVALLADMRIMRAR